MAGLNHSSNRLDNEPELVPLLTTAVFTDSNKRVYPENVLLLFSSLNVYIKFLECIPR